MWSIITQVLNFLGDTFVKFVDIVLSILPPSPFTLFLNAGVLNDYIKYINYFFPVTELIIVVEAWILCVGIFYIYQVIMRWIKLIG